MQVDSLYRGNKFPRACYYTLLHGNSTQAKGSSKRDVFLSMFTSQGNKLHESRNRLLIYDECVCYPGGELWNSLVLVFSKERVQSRDLIELK